MSTLTNFGQALIAPPSGQSWRRRGASARNPRHAGPDSDRTRIDFDHIGFSMFRTADGQCIDLMDAFLIMEFGGHIKVDSGPTLQFHDRRGHLIHEVNPAGPISRIHVRFDAESAELDKEIRQRWLDRRVREREAARAGRQFRALPA